MRSSSEAKASCCALCCRFVEEVPTEKREQCDPVCDQQPPMNHRYFKMDAVPISDTAIRPDTARYAYREVSKNYDLKIKDLIPDTPSDTSRYSVRYFWANNTSFERASGAHQRRPIQVELII